MATLLEKAKAVRITPLPPGWNTPDAERVELAVAWAFGVVTTRQVAVSLGRNVGTGVYSILARSLQQAAKNKLIVRREGCYSE